MAKAKEIHKTNIRYARTPLLAELDIEFQKDYETWINDYNTDCPHQFLNYKM